MSSLDKHKEIVLAELKKRLKRDDEEFILNGIEYEIEGAPDYRIYKKGDLSKTDETKVVFPIILPLLLQGLTDEKLKDDDPNVDLIAKLTNETINSNENLLTALKEYQTALIAEQRKIEQQAAQKAASEIPKNLDIKDASTGKLVAKPSTHATFDPAERGKIDQLNALIEMPPNIDNELKDFINETYSAEYEITVANLQKKYPDHKITLENKETAYKVNIDPPDPKIVKEFHEESNQRLLNTKRSLTASDGHTYEVTFKMPEPVPERTITPIKSR